jgi:ABC-type Mn2+/Zn2+ transport system ATPase subunit
MSMNGSLFRFEDARLGYGRQTILHGVEVEIRASDFFGLVGPNGSGKTTLLRSLLGILKPKSGKIWRAPQLKVGYVPQRESLDPLFPITALEIVLMGRYPRMGFLRGASRTDRQAALHYLEQVGLAEHALSLFRSLSGGQRQRVLIARALATEPNLLVLDEPTNGLDLPTEANILSLIEHLHTVQGLTIVLVSHQLNVVARYSTRMGVLMEGRLLTGSTPELMQERVLQEVYGIPVSVQEVDGHYWVAPHEPYQQETRAGDELG